MTRKPIILLAVAATILGLAVWGFVEGRQERAEEKDREAPVKTTSRVVATESGTAVVFDQETQERAGIAVAAVQAAARRSETEAVATVLPPQELIELRNGYVAAKAQAERVAAAMNASRREYDRIKSLHDDGRNVSDKVLEAAQAASRGDEAQVAAAREALDAAGRGARQKWGTALAAAVAQGGPLFRNLADQRQVLVRVALSAGSGIGVPPATARLEAGDGVIRTARLISPSPQVDPRIQGPTFFYAAAAEGLLPGTTLTAYLPAGTERKGCIVPGDAVVWWQGKAWFYVQSASDRFMRRELVGAMPVESGWFVPGLEGVQVVVRGAQTLLSEELRAQIPTGEEDE